MRATGFHEATGGRPAAAAAPKHSQEPQGASRCLAVERPFCACTHRDGHGTQESRKNQLKDFVHIAGPLKVSHFLILTATEQAAYLRLCKVPKVCQLRMDAFQMSVGWVHELHVCTLRVRQVSQAG